MDFLKRLIETGKGRFLALPPLQRILLVALGGAGLLAVGFLLFLSQQTDYGVLFANLAQDDAAAITAKLKSKKVSYRLEGGGTTILVPRSEVYELRLQLAGEGIPRGGNIGFELFDRQNLGATDFVQRLNYQRALQGELARTIVGMPEVAEARVHIVTPKESLFVEDQQKASASVAVKLRPGRTLNPAQIDGIAHLVASSVPGLHPRQVTILDLDGKILSKPQDSLTPDGLSAGQTTFQRQVEDSLERKVQSLLDQVVGPRKSLARVSAELDFRKIDLREENYSPNKDLIRSEQKSMERSFKGPDGGNPESPFNLNRGAITAPPPGKGPPPLTPPATQAAAGGGGMERQSELRNYEISKAVRQVVDQPGKIKRLFVAVAVDGIYKGKIFSPRSTEELRQLASLLKKTVGFDTERGDQFEITSVPLASATPEGVVAVSPPGGWQESLMSSLKVGLLVLLVLGGLMFLLKKRRAGSKPSLLEAPSVPGLPAPAGVQVTLSGEEAAAALPPVPGVQPVLTLPDLVQGQDRVALLIANYPERALEVLRLWLHEKTK